MRQLTTDEVELVSGGDRGDAAVNGAVGGAVVGATIGAMGGGAFGALAGASIGFFIGMHLGVAAYDKGMKGTEGFTRSPR